ncbi:MAG: tetratricopeptide repeat protein [bacterium]|nr:tetratricopeptide repeat protein [bacterium]
MKQKRKRRRRAFGARAAQTPQRRAGFLLIAGLPALLAFGVFATTITDALVYDDIWKSRQLSGPVAPFWTLLLRSRGLTHAVHLMDQALWGDWTPGFHLTNVLLHSLASALVAGAGFAVTRSRRVALVAGLIFAVHPVHVEAVASFSNRKDILAMIFVALALIIWRGARWAVGRYLAALVCFALALLAKEVAAVGLVGMLFLADLLALPGNSASWRSRLRRAALRSPPFLLGGLVFAFRVGGDLTRNFKPDGIHQISELQLHTYDQVLANVLGSVPDQIRLLLFPLRLCADYTSSPDLKLGSPEAAAGLVLIGLWILAILFLAGRAPPFSFATAWALVTYLPCSNLVPLIHFFVAERYLYVPSFGVCLLLALAFERCLSWAQARRPAQVRVAVIAAIVLLVIAGGVRTGLRNRDWRNARSLWEAALRSGCETPRAHHNLGDALAREGRKEEAIPHLVKALRSGPLTVRNRTKLVLLLMGVGAYEEVERECHSILRDSPEVWGCHAYLGKIAIGKGDPAQAVRHYKEVLKAQPTHVEVLTQLVRLLVTHPDAEFRDLPEALELAERARAATGDSDPEVLYHLALLHAEAGDIDAAVRYAGRALGLARSRGRMALVREIYPTLVRLSYIRLSRGRYPPSER